MEKGNPGPVKLEKTGKDIKSSIEKTYGKLDSISQASKTGIKYNDFLLRYNAEGLMKSDSSIIAMGLADRNLKLKWLLSRNAEQNQIQNILDKKRWGYLSSELLENRQDLFVVPDEMKTSLFVFIPEKTGTSGRNYLLAVINLDKSLDKILADKNLKVSMYYGARKMAGTWEPDAGYIPAEFEVQVHNLSFVLRS